MAPATHTADDEDAFMRGILGGIDSSFIDVPPPPDRSPVRPNVESSDAASSLRSDFVTPTRPRISKSPPFPPADKQNPSPQIGVSYDAGEVDIEEATQGWDWDALSDYVPTPQKPKTSGQKVCVGHLMLMLSYFRIGDVSDARTRI